MLHIFCRRTATGAEVSRVAKCVIQNELTLLYSGGRGRGSMQFGSRAGTRAPFKCDEVFIYIIHCARPDPVITRIGNFCIQFRRTCAKSKNASRRVLATRTRRRGVVWIEFRAAADERDIPYIVISLKWRSPPPPPAIHHTHMCGWVYTIYRIRTRARYPISAICRTQGRKKLGWSGLVGRESIRKYILKPTRRTRDRGSILNINFSAGNVFGKLCKLLYIPYTAYLYATAAYVCVGIYNTLFWVLMVANKP